MHKVVMPDWALERVMMRRGKPYAFDQLDPKRTALVVVDLQNGFMAPGQPAEVPVAREIVDNVNTLAAAVRAGGGLVVLHQTHIRRRDGDRLVGLARSFRHRRLGLAHGGGVHLWPLWPPTVAWPRC